MLKTIILTTFIILLSACNSVETPGSKSEENVNQVGWSLDSRNLAIESCTIPGNPRNYCECSVSILETFFTHAEFVELDEILRSGVRPPDEIIAKMTEMQKEAQEKCGFPSPIK